MYVQKFIVQIRCNGGWNTVHVILLWPLHPTNKRNQMKLHTLSLTIRIITSHYAARNCQNSKMICRVATCFWREHYAKHDYGVLHVDNGWSCNGPRLCTSAYCSVHGGLHTIIQWTVRCFQACLFNWRVAPTWSSSLDGHRCYKRAHDDWWRHGARKPRLITVNACSSSFVYKSRAI